MEHIFWLNSKGIPIQWPNFRSQFGALNYYNKGYRLEKLCIPYLDIQLNEKINIQEIKNDTIRIYRDKNIVANISLKNAKHSFKDAYKIPINECFFIY